MLTIELIDPEGNKLGKDTNMNIKFLEGREKRANFILEINGIQFSKPGEYKFVISADSKENLGEYKFQVIKPQE